MEKREVLAKKAISFCITEKGIDRAGRDGWGSVSFSLGVVRGERLVAYQVPVLPATANIITPHPRAREQLRCLTRGPTKTLTVDIFC